MNRTKFIFSQTLVNAFIVVGTIVLPVVSFKDSDWSMSVTAATTATQPSQNAEASHPGVTVDLTSVVVAALTLGFGYGVLKTFQGNGK